jgi:glycosyltransferase involved in cell wall biosynthesis
MRLLFVIDNLWSGGAQRQFTILASEMVRRGHSVDAFVYYREDHFGPELAAAGVRILLHPKPRRLSLDPARRLRSLYRNGNYDVVLSFLPGPNTFALLAAIGLRKRPKVVVSERSFLLPSDYGPRRRFLEWLYPRADHITANSHHMREYYARRYGWGEDRVSTIWNGLDLERFASTAIERRPGEPLKLLCVGRILPLKNWRLLAEAAVKLKSEGLRFQVSLAGRLEGLSAVETEYFASIVALLREHDIEDSWNFLGVRSNVAELFASHHALVHPSVVEGLANSICESLACGRPVLATDAFDHRRLIQSGATGWLFDAQSVDSLADAIRRLDALPVDRLQQMGAAARRFAEEHLTVSRLADEYEALFRRLIGQAAHERSSNGNSTESAEVADVALKR